MTHDAGLQVARARSQASDLEQPLRQSQINLQATISDAHSEDMHARRLAQKLHDEQETAARATAVSSMSIL